MQTAGPLQASVLWKEIVPFAKEPVCSSSLWPGKKGLPTCHPLPQRCAHLQLGSVVLAAAEEKIAVGNLSHWNEEAVGVLAASPNYPAG